MTIPFERHVGVYAICMRNDRILVIHKARGPYMGKFDLPGGSLDDGETLDQALVREVQEETGYAVRSATQLFARDTLFFYEKRGIKTSFHHIGVFYSVELEELPEKDPEMDQDAHGYSWVSLEHITPETTAQLACEAIFDVLNQ